MSSQFGFHRPMILVTTRKSMPKLFYFFFPVVYNLQRRFSSRFGALYCLFDSVVGVESLVNVSSLSITLCESFSNVT